MQLLEHAFNLRQLVGQIKRNRDIPNLEEKVRQLFRGAVVTKPEVCEEMIEIIDAEARKAKEYLEKKREELEALQNKSVESEVAP